MGSYIKTPLFGNAGPSLKASMDSPMEKNENACKTLTNILSKAYCLNLSDTEKEKGCLRRKEKLSS